VTFELAVGSGPFCGSALALMLRLTVGEAIGKGVPFALLPLGALASYTQIEKFHHSKCSTVPGSTVMGT